MTPGHRHLPEGATGTQRAPEPTLARGLSIARRATAATPGRWGYLRPSEVICAGYASEVAHCLHNPDAVFIAHARSDIPWLLGRLHRGQATDLAPYGQLLDRLLVLRAAIRVADQQLNTLPWQRDGLHRFFAEGLGARSGSVGGPGDRGGGQRPGPRVPRAQRRRPVNGVGMWAGPPAASGASAARPSHHPTRTYPEGVVAPLS
jgi:hypothetical protein